MNSSSAVTGRNESAGTESRHLERVVDRHDALQSTVVEDGRHPMHGQYPPTGRRMVLHAGRAGKSGARAASTASSSITRPGLSDREAAQAVRTDLRWKVAAGLALDDEGFHPTVLTLWRNKLRGSERPQRIFDAVRDVVAATGVLAGRTRRALDSTLLDDAVATQDTVTQLVSMIRRVRRAIPAAATVTVAADDYDAPGKPVCAWDDPTARDELITGLVNDARAILAALADVELDDEQQALVGLLALVAGQDVEEGDTPGSWRIARKVAKDRVISTVDPETRHMHKSRSNYRDGYKAHVAVEPETGIITGVELTPANAGDGPTGAQLLNGEEPGLQVLGDSAYGSGPVRADLAEHGHTAVIKPWPTARKPYLDDDQFGRDDFTIDHAARTVTCPNGTTVRIAARGAASFGARCAGCPLRTRCTASATGKTFTVTEHDQLLTAARADWRAGIGVDDYRQWRPMVERSIAWLVTDGHRRVRYRGVERNRLGLHIRAAVINLRRLLTLGLTHNTNGWSLATT
jgi:IS5 family transposase